MCFCWEDFIVRFSFLRIFEDEFVFFMLFMGLEEVDILGLLCIMLKYIVFVFVLIKILSEYF